jgi:cytochrome c oxidase assembly protein subunit 15
MESAAPILPYADAAVASQQRYSRGLHAIALLTAAATFPLIFMGGLVTSHQAGMSVPDWPNSYGYNMFLFPPRLWVGGILYEHTHRLMGSIVGLLSIILAAWAWKTEFRRWVRWLAYAVLGAVIFQGVLGGLRVVLVKLNLAIVHACFAQAFFCLASLVALVTSRRWIEPQAQPAAVSHRRLAVLGVIAVAVIYSQLIVGAVMRHYRAGLAITDLPLAYGRLLPPTDVAGLDRINRHRQFPSGVTVIRGEDIPAFEQLTERVTLAQVWIHFAHRIGALCVAAAVLALTIHVLRKHRRQRDLIIPALALLVLLTAQMTLGVLTVLLWKPADVASAHVAVGALTLMTTFVLTARAVGSASADGIAAVPGELPSAEADPTRRLPSGRGGQARRLNDEFAGASSLSLGVKVN